MKKIISFVVVFLFIQTTFAALPLTLPAVPIGTGQSQVIIASSYYTAKVSFMNGSTIVYTATLIQQAPKMSLPANLKVGTTTIVNGTLSMTLPSRIASGSITFMGTISVDGGAPQQINTVIGSWKLNQ